MNNQELITAIGKLAPLYMDETTTAIIVDAPDKAADSIGHIELAEVVAAYTASAVAVGKRAKAKAAQKDLVGLFKTRKVVKAAIANAEARLRKIS